MKELSDNKWDYSITPKSKSLHLDFKELWAYQDLFRLFIRRDIITIYKQTILGPLWFLIQPLLTMAIFILVFKNIAKISTDGIPAPVFYLSGIIVWNYFSVCFTRTANTFHSNARVFGKIYFPRLITPVSKVVSEFLKFAIQFLLFIFVYLYYLLNGYQFAPNIMLLIIPYLILLILMLGLGGGLILSSITSKYKDLNFIIGFGVQLLMYASPVIYPVSIVPEKYHQFILMNPMAHIIEAFKYAFIGHGYISFDGLLYTSFIAIILFASGIYLFNKTEQNFIDTI